MDQHKGSGCEGLTKSADCSDRHGKSRTLITCRVALRLAGCQVERRACDTLRRPRLQSNPGPHKQLLGSQFTLASAACSRCCCCCCSCTLLYCCAECIHHCGTQHQRRGGGACGVRLMAGKPGMHTCSCPCLDNVAILFVIGPFDG